MSADATLDASRIDPFVTALSSAVTAFAIYPADHPQAQQALRDLVGGFRRVVEVLDPSRQRAVDEQAGLSLLVLEDDLVVQGRPWHRQSPVARSLCKALNRAGLERLTLTPGLSAVEAEQVIVALASASAPETTRHVTVGRLELLPGEGEGEGTTKVTRIERAADALLTELRQIGPIFEAESERVRMVRVERAVWKLTESALAQERGFLLHASLHGATDAFWRHGIQVALLTLPVARQLGLEGSTLADLMLAAVLHDIGRLEISGTQERRQPELPLWRHTELGAERLAITVGLPPVCALVAYEHHLHWDGRGGFPSPGRRPGLASQIVAVADGYDVAWQACAGLEPRRRRQLAAAGVRQQKGLQPDLVERLLAQLA
ncbi:MAG: HD domain-containing protein [Acidobacteria bacterium]|nr:MAG: HD domain-containing protein [Acidobacteriota bacterium]REJ99408.1 MAG: HD domain-containing protein [Acidobacteriota bacterium]